MGAKLRKPDDMPFSLRGIDPFHRSVPTLSRVIRQVIWRLGRVHRLADDTHLVPHELYRMCHGRQVNVDIRIVLGSPFRVRKPLYCGSFSLPTDSSSKIASNRGRMLFVLAYTHGAGDV